MTILCRASDQIVRSAASKVICLSTAGPQSRSTDAPSFLTWINKVSNVEPRRFAWRTHTAAVGVAQGQILFATLGHEADRTSVSDGPCMPKTDTKVPSARGRRWSFAHAKRIGILTWTTFRRQSIFQSAGLFVRLPCRANKLSRSLSECSP